MAIGKSQLSPLMQQFHAIKNNHPDVLLLFQVGDFYEFFFDDAKIASSFLGIALTQRGCTPSGDPIPLCGVPVHTLNTYITKLVKGGFKVAICDQVGAKHGKIIERTITQVLTPGTLTDDTLLDEKSASYLCSFFVTQQHITLIFAELLTGQLCITTVANTSPKLLEAELGRFVPDEIVLPTTKLCLALEPLFQRLGYSISREQFNPHEDDILEETRSWFCSQFSQSKEFFAQSDSFSNALVVLYTYLRRNNERSLSQLKQLLIYQPEDFLMLDAATVRNLELVKNSRDGSSAHTLFDILDNAVTAMGSRVLKKWLLRPLVKRDQIEQRLDVIACFLASLGTKEELRRVLKQIGDIERIVGRIGLRRAQLHDYCALMRALNHLPEITRLLDEQSKVSLISLIKAKTVDFEQLLKILQQSLNDDSDKEWLIKSNCNAELDRLRLLAEQGAQAIVALERKEQEHTGINSLKIRFSGAHGYGIEVTKPNLSLVPPHYIRTQTLVNRERFTTQELKDLEYDIARARTDIGEIEKELFEALKMQVEQYLHPLKKLAQALSYLDALQALTHTAYTYGYIRPEFNNRRELILVDARHPVIEKRIGPKFIPNSVRLTDEETLWIITGPNMGGKSTFLRQIALTSIMAQMGSFVPAKEANLALLDRIFTRIGASDNVAEGKSTFLVEMEETALICTQATRNSLVILDEVGRGTSTFDGLAIAQAVVEYIFTHVQAHCLFATHYHELSGLAATFPGIVFYYASSARTADGIVLLHKILPGMADGSFGLEVAKLAQLPTALLERADAILREFIHNGNGAPKALSVVGKTDVLAFDKATEKTSAEGLVDNPYEMVITQERGQWQEKYALLAQQKHQLEVLLEQREKELGQQKLVSARLSELDMELLSAKQALDILWTLKESV